MTGPRLPTARGPLSDAVVFALNSGVSVPPLTEHVREAEPYGDDLQLALYVLYELHYRGFAGVADESEWDPGLLSLRRGLELRFTEALRTDVPPGPGPEEALEALLVEPAGHDEASVSHFLQRYGASWQLKEYAALRSLYHLKEADPHAWVIPRLRGRAKAAMVAVEYDEFGAGRAERMHSRLFADLLAAAGLSPEYLHYLDRAPACALATVNMMSLFGLHRRWRGALAGHFTAAEITTGPSAQRMDEALARLCADPACRLFYTEHVEADAVHEQVMRHDVLGDLLEQEPNLAADVVFGIQATELLEDRLGEHLLGNWRAGRSALL